MIFLDFVILVLGFVALVKGADIFVDGSSALAKIFKVPGVIIGLTVVALGTSLPELAVSTTAALAGANEIALSNVIGSNIFNLLVVLGVCAVIHSVPVDEVIIRRDFPLSIIVTLGLLLAVGWQTISGGSFFTLGMADNAGLVSRVTGIILLVIFIGYILFLIFDAIRHPVEEEEISDIPLWKALLFILIGVILIIAGGKAVVYSAQNIARFFGMTETLIGLTVVALGTSLPELVTSIVAARKGETSLAVGNVVGSNLFNLLFILGVSTSIHPITVNAASIYDMAILIFVSCMTLFFSITGRSIKRLEGIIMLACYIGATTFAIVR
ncbi:putative K+-dependent Na+/Ca+ exchanger family protein [Treponema sp. JC4]|uniref:calcium/sodium antiporter n=1 Tax=Treponema sp. JC4 TaxID=1124982 RepID=UPI00025B02F2|nr:calcium/sodium antiporter [Treponema sp. JC4]EID85076.1 putative K+-dependent Na+/Ca+ exchanger family protein [Treponema sp. JC4]